MDTSLFLPDIPASAYTLDSNHPGWGKRLRQRAKSLVKQVDTTYMDLARCLFTIYNKPLETHKAKGPIYKAWGYDYFGDYVTGELDMDVKRAQRLKRIWQVIAVDLKLDEVMRDRISDLGFSKARELVRVLTLDNVEEWVERAEGMTYKEILSAIQVHQNGIRDARDAAASALPEGEDTGTTAYSTPESTSVEVFGLYPEQAQNVKSAIERAGQLSQSPVKSHNLDLICQNFLATNDFGKGDRSAEIQKFVRNMERAMKVQMIVYDPSCGEVVFGFDLLKKLAGWEDDEVPQADVEAEAV